MADVPKDLLDQITRLEELFTVPQEKLKEITEHFQNELAKGLSVEGGSIVSDESASLYALAANTG
jgi:hexokinase